MEAIANKRPITGQLQYCRDSYVNNRAHAQQLDSDKQFSIKLRRAARAGCAHFQFPYLTESQYAITIAFYYRVCRLRILLW